MEPTSPKGTYTGNRVFNGLPAQIKDLPIIEVNLNVPGIISFTVIHFIPSKNNLALISCKPPRITTLSKA